MLCGRAARTDLERASYVAWGGWVLVTGLVFSFMSGNLHDYYTVALAPGVATVVGIGSVHLWRNRERRWVTRLLAIILALTTAWAWVLLGKAPDFVPALRWMVVIAALADPVAYCVQTVSTAHSGPIIVAGPSNNGGLPQFAGGGPPPGRGKPSEQVGQKLAANGDDYTWVAAATGSIEASGYQLATGKSVMPIGGFAGADPAPTLQQFQGYVEGGRVHYYLESSRRGMPFFDR